MIVPPTAPPIAPLTGVALRGICTAVPSGVARTADYTLLTEAERAKFAAGTGIEQRRVAAAGQYTSDLCIAAAGELLARLDWDKASVQALVMITQTGDHPVPATAIIVQHKLGLPTSCAAFDINLGCSSYPYGLAVLGSMMRTLGLRRALLLVGDVSTRLCSYNDKSSWPLFGDAGSATALELDAAAAPIHFDLNSDGAGKDAIIVEAGGLASRKPARPPALPKSSSRQASRAIRPTCSSRAPISSASPSVQCRPASAACSNAPAGSWTASTTSSCTRPTR
jgi:3-oxoacyl-[acyl-carrier-protein] synthase-3